MRRFSEEVIHAAHQADLGEWLRGQGVPLNADRTGWRLAAHPSCRIEGNRYYWHSKSEGGGTVDYLKRYHGFDYVGAVKALTGAEGEENGTGTNENGVRWVAGLQVPNIPANGNNRRVLAYLSKQRGIDYGIAKEFITRGLLYESEEHHNAVFPIINACGVCVGAELRGTSSEKSFKGMKGGDGYGFNAPMYAHEACDYVIFFESALDLLAFVTLKRRNEGKSLSRTLLVSLGGTKPNVFDKMHSTFAADCRVFLAVDADEAGERLCSEVAARQIAFTRLAPPFGKDWNDTLLAFRGSDSRSES